MYEFKVGDKGKTRGGWPYRVICTDAKLPFSCIVALVMRGNDEIIIAYTKEGLQFDDATCGLDILPPRQKCKVWVNVYSDCVVNGQLLYTSKCLADHFAGLDRIACVEVEIEYTPGEGL